MLKSSTLLKFTVILIAFCIMLCNQFLNAQAQTMSPTENSIPLLVLDEDPGLTLPKAFRTTNANFFSDKKISSVEGLEDLKAAASAQFSTHTLQNALKSMDGPVWIIDLRKESHGFINDIPISWYSAQNRGNVEESDDNILRQEAMLFSDLKRLKVINVNQIVEKKEGNIEKATPILFNIEQAFPEVTLANRLNLGYLRLGVLDHHRPEDSTVDHFIDFVKTLPPESWLYFHCRGGKGRSTTFMVMYDILRNGHKVSLEQIVERQALLGGSNLFDISEEDGNTWKKEAAIDRKNFITKFYQYVKDRRGYPEKSWSEWSKKH